MKVRFFKLCNQMLLTSHCPFTFPVKDPSENYLSPWGHLGRHNVPCLILDLPDLHTENPPVSITSPSQILLMTLIF